MSQELEFKIVTDLTFKRYFEKAAAALAMRLAETEAASAGRSRAEIEGIREARFVLERARGAYARGQIDSAFRGFFWALACASEAGYPFLPE